jgi:hypothetical protein
VHGRTKVRHELLVIVGRCGHDRTLPSALLVIQSAIIPLLTVTFSTWARRVLRGVLWDALRRRHR